MVEWLDLDQTRLLHGKTKKFTRLNTAFYSKPQGGYSGFQVTRMIEGFFGV